jgi:ribonucleoside-diphosphate reductase alpha chain
MREIEYQPSKDAYQVLINGRILAPGETPQQMFRRVVDTLFSIEVAFGTPAEESLEAKTTFAQFMAEQTFTPGTPTLTNAGRPGYEKSALCSCALIPVDLRQKEESAEMIKAYYRQNMGSGFDLTPYADPLGLLIWLNDLSIVETATGKYDRYIGNMANLHVAHPKINEYITAKRERNLRHFNLSVIVNDAFMEAAKKKDVYIQADGTEVNAYELLTTMAESVWTTGDPSILNLERMNQYNPLPELAPYISAPPCAEMGLARGETCQFAYINIAKFLTPQGIDYSKLAQVTRVVTRALDNAVELGLQNFPHPDSTVVAQLKRKIGIAATGLADTLLYLDLPYDSGEARQLARDVLSFINYTSKCTSVELAEQRGSCEAMNHRETNKYYQTYLEDRYGQGTNTVISQEWCDLADYIRRTGMLRNITTTTLPPAARVSILMSTSFGIEPIFGMPDKVENLRPSVVNFVWRHAPQRIDEIIKQAVSEGTFQNVDLPPELRECLKTAKEIDYKGHLKMVAELVGEKGVVDESASKTVNLPKVATPDDIVNIFLLAHDLGLINISAYRDGTYEDQPQKL